MASSQSGEPIGFFTLPRELRDEIDEVEFGVNGQLVVRFPLPRLHHISRRFTGECDSRAPTEPPLIAVSQKYGDFQPSIWVIGRQRMERIGCPRIVNLRPMQSQPLVKRVRINLYASNGTECDLDMGSLGIVARVHTRFMLDDARDIDYFRDIPQIRSLRSRSIALDIVVDCPSDQECHEEEFSRAKILAEWHPGSCWRFDDEEIERCQAIADVQSEWSTAAPSPKSSQGEETGDYHELTDVKRPTQTKG